MALREGGLLGPVGQPWGGEGTLSAREQTPQPSLHLPVLPEPVAPRTALLPSPWASEPGHGLGASPPHSCFQATAGWPSASEPGQVQPHLTVLGPVPLPAPGSPHPSPPDKERWNPLLAQGAPRVKAW